MELASFLEPLPARDIEWRVQQCGEKDGKIWAKVLAYVTNRAIMAKLDDVVGPGGWKNEFREGPGGGILCGISIKIDGEWVTKWDGAENTDIEAVKGGLSGAMKRAAVQWGIGRYLYDLEEGWAKVHAGGQHSAKTKDNKWYKWDPPELPSWALPTAAPPQKQSPVLTPALIERLRDLAKKVDADHVEFVEKKIALGLKYEEAKQIAEDLKAQLALTGATA